MLKKIILGSLLLLVLGGCSGHTTSMQDVTSFCRSYATKDFCDTQDSICAKYSEIMLAPYNSAKECRMSCDKIRMTLGDHPTQGDCLQLVQSVGSKCNEFCNSNYK